MKVLINPVYENDSKLHTFIDSLPDSFDNGSNILWNGRNKIKAFPLSLCNSDGTEELVVVKRFKKLNPIQKVIYAFRRHKARKAYENGLQLQARGFDTPEPIACVEIWRSVFLSDAYYLCRHFSGTEIAESLNKDDWDKDVAAAFAAFVARLHEAGILHHDLNSTNCLYNCINGEYKFTLIDINRMDFYDDISAISMVDRIENLTRFTGRYDVFEFVAREYAVVCGLNVDEWSSQALAQKKRHDRNWYRRKRILHPWKKQK